MIITSLAKVALIVMACTGDVREQKCGDEYAVETWVAATHQVAKEECERFLRDDFDPKAYLYIEEDDYAAVRCE